MNDITLMDVLYTGGMLFVAFYGAIIITKLLGKYTKLTDDEQEDKEKKEEKE